MSTKTWSVGRSLLFLGAAFASAILVDQMVGCMSAPAQQKNMIAVAAGSQLPATADDLIRQMAASSGVIFVGQVVEVRRPAGYAGSPQDAAEGIVEVDFRVERAVRGPAKSSIYTLREWAGLWAGGTDRYRAGQRFLMLLRSPDASGFSSPVRGAEGAIPLRGAGIAPRPDDFSSTPAQWMADIRWLQAQILRSQVRLAAPPRGPIPILGGRGPHAKADRSLRDANPLFVRALPGPWLGSSDTVAPVEPLSHVLSLCAEKAEP